MGDYRKSLAAAAACAILLAACGGESPPPMEQRSAAEPAAEQPEARQATGSSLRAIARMEPKSGSSVSGAVVFTAFEGPMVMGGVLDGGEPGTNAIHIHEVGDCSAPDGTSAGPHFNPAGAPHGSPDEPDGQHHAGDLGNITFDEHGQARFDRVLGEGLTFEGGTGIIGRAVIVHAEPDDFETQPTGAAGARIACGVIELLQ
ncbi:superoxide dismutase family protein [Lentisalinibacter sediminis]|uniref:superoxide dismutase family protein n=1 Tax=Lentisalinibacter sediminis TaxID=2992237 RepID=UPI00386670DE